MAQSLWVYKCKNDPGTQNLAYGNWSTVFKRPWKNTPWGGAWVTGKPDGKIIFDDDIQKGDLVVAWQTDKGHAVGLCEVVGWKASKVDGRDLVLLPVEEFDPPVRLHDLKRTTHPKLATVSALKPGNVATIYRTSRSEARLILQACRASTPLA